MKDQIELEQKLDHLKKYYKLHGWRKTLKQIQKLEQKLSNW
jgi:hypothetical protein